MKTEGSGGRALGGRGTAELKLPAGRRGRVAGGDFGRSTAGVQHWLGLWVSAQEQLCWVNRPRGPDVSW